MTYEAFVTELRRLGAVVSAAYSPDHYPGSKSWSVYAIAVENVRLLREAYPYHSLTEKIDTAADMVVATVPEPGSLMDRIERGETSVTETFPIQKFRLGDCVRANGLVFIVDTVRVQGGCVDYRAFGYPWFASDDLTLAPKRPPYVPSERRVVVTDCDHRTRIAYYKSVCRCETDAEMAGRHAIERAEYDAQGSKP